MSGNNVEKQNIATPTATRDEEGNVHFRRELPGTAEQLWQFVADPEKCALWIGPWSGDPATKQVELTMTAEEPGPPMSVQILDCIAPNRLVTDTGMWQLEMEVEDGAMTLVHNIDSAEDAESIGPGWEYYMDRLALAVAGGDPESVDFEKTYYPAMSAYFRELY